METRLTLELRKIGHGFNTYHVISWIRHNSSLVRFPRLEVPFQANWGGGLRWCEDCSKNVGKLQNIVMAKGLLQQNSEKARFHLLIVALSWKVMGT